MKNPEIIESKEAKSSLKLMNLQNFKMVLKMRSIRNPNAPLTYYLGSLLVYDCIKYISKMLAAAKFLSISAGSFEFVFNESINFYII